MAERPKREGVMLAYPGDEGRIRRLGDRVFAQPKFKGERSRVEWFKDEPYLLSSYGNEFNQLPHINAFIKNSPELKDIPLDGELYIHGKPFDGKDGIHSICARRTNKHSFSDTMQFHIFDIQWEDQSQWFRINALKHLEEDGILRHPVIAAKTKIIETADWLNQMNKWVNDGYEGIILRSPIAPYFMKRDVCLIKIKPTEIDEYKIIEVTEAIDKHGVPKGTTGSFLVEDREGLQFYVGAGKLKHAERDAIWEDRAVIANRTLVVKHEPEVTKGGVPVCAVAVKIK